MLLLSESSRAAVKVTAEKWWGVSAPLTPNCSQWKCLYGLGGELHSSCLWGSRVGLDNNCRHLHQKGHSALGNSHPMKSTTWVEESNDWTCRAEWIIGFRGRTEASASEALRNISTLHGHAWDGPSIK